MNFRINITSVALIGGLFLTQTLFFTVKVSCFIWFFMLIRWTLPRFRYDQLMHLGWKILFPLALVNIVITSLIVVAFG